MARLSNGTTTYGLNVSNRQENGANLLQVDDDLTDATTLVFPAIGAALMLLFGGLLLTTAFRCRVADSKNGSFERSKKRLSRAITFYNAPYELCTKATSVLQQENNDIVDAVIKQYGDLTHYETTTDHNANFKQSYYHSFARPEMVDKALSPIYVDRKDSDSAVSASPPFQSCDGAVVDQGIECRNDRNGRTVISEQKNEPTLSRSGMDMCSRCSFDDDSLERFSLHQDGTEGQNAQREGENSYSGPLKKHCSSCSEDETVVDGGGRNIPLSQRAPSSESCVSVHKGRRKRPREKTKINGYDPVRPNLQSASDSSVGAIFAVSDDASDSKAKDRTLQDPASSITTANTLTRENTQRCNQSPARKLALENTLTKENTQRCNQIPARKLALENTLTRENVQRCKQSPARKLALEKWLTDVQTFYPFHGILPEMDNSESDSTKSRLVGTNSRRQTGRLSKVNVGQVRMRTTSRRWPRAGGVRRARFIKDDLGELKRLPISLVDHSSESDTGMDEYSGSCLHRMRQPNLHCTDSRRGLNNILNTRDEKPGGGQKAKMPNAVESDRLRPLQVVCAPSVRCANRPQCGTQCQEKPTGVCCDSSDSHQKVSTSGQQEAQDCFVEQQLRGASYFGGTQILAQPESEDHDIRGASSLGVEGPAASRCTGAQHSLVKEQLRGASSFCGTQIHAQPESKECRIRGASSLAGQGQVSADNSDAELRGASVFGGSHIISQVIKRKTSRTELLGLRSEPFQSEINASEMRSASSFGCPEDRRECTSSITLTIAHDSDGENSQCETDSLKSRLSYNNSSAVSVKSNNTVIAAANISSVGMEERKQSCTEDKLHSASSEFPRASGRCYHKNAVKFDQEVAQVTDPTTWCARGLYSNSCVDVPATDRPDLYIKAPEKSGVSCVETSTPVESNEAARSTSKLSRESILNVGKDISVMSAVLHALRKQRDNKKDRRKA